MWIKVHMDASEEAAECRTEQFRAQYSSGTHLLKTVGSKSNFILKIKKNQHHYSKLWSCKSQWGGWLTLDMKWSKDFQMVSGLHSLILSFSHSHFHIPSIVVRLYNCACVKQIWSDSDLKQTHCQAHEIYYELVLKWHMLLTFGSSLRSKKKKS